MNYLTSKINYLISLIVIIGITTISSCKSPEQKVEDAAENVVEEQKDLNKAEEDYATEVANFRNETNDRITANEVLIADFKSRMKEEKGEAKAEYDRQVNALEEKNSAMKKRMNDYKDDSASNWQSFKNEFNHDMDALGNALKDLTENNKK